MTASRKSPQQRGADLVWVLSLPAHVHYSHRPGWHKEQVQAALTADLDLETGAVTAVLRHTPRLTRRQLRARLHARVLDVAVHVRRAVPHEVQDVAREAPGASTDLNDPQRIDRPQLGVLGQDVPRDTLHVAGRIWEWCRIRSRRLSCTVRQDSAAPGRNKAGTLRRE